MLFFGLAEKPWSTERRGISPPLFMFLEDKCLCWPSKTLDFMAFVSKSYKNIRTKIDKIRQSLVDFTFYLFTLHYSLKTTLSIWSNK